MGPKVSADFPSENCGGRLARELHAPIGDVLADAIARDRVEGRCLGNRAAAASDHDDEFDLPVDAVRREVHVGVWADQAAREFREYQRLLWDREIGFFGVVAVIQSDPEDLLGPRDASLERTLVEWFTARIGSEGSRPVREFIPAGERVHRICAEPPVGTRFDIDQMFAEDQARHSVRICEMQRHGFPESPR